MSDLEVRMSVMELEQRNLKDNIQELKKCSNETYDLIYGLKEKLDKQNGTIPHMAEDIKNIYENVEELSIKFGRYIAKNEKSRLKINVLWASIGVILTGLLSLILNMFIK